MTDEKHYEFTGHDSRGNPVIRHYQGPNTQRIADEVGADGITIDDITEILEEDTEVLHPEQQRSRK